MSLSLPCQVCRNQLRRQRAETSSGTVPAALDCVLWLPTGFETRLRDKLVRGFGVITDLWPPLTTDQMPFSSEEPSRACAASSGQFSTVDFSECPLRDMPGIQRWVTETQPLSRRVPSPVVQFHGLAEPARTCNMTWASTYAIVSERGQ